MKKIIIIIILISFSTILVAQQYTKKELKYKPKNLEEAIHQLDIMFPDTTKKQIKLMTEDEFIGKTHFTTGMYIRNYWLYDRYLFSLIVLRSELRDTLTNLGLFHNDDMSGLILRSFYRYLTDQELDVKGQIKETQQYWINVSNPEWRAEQARIGWEKYMATFNIGDTLTRNLYYDRDWLGNPRKNTFIQAKIIDKNDTLLKIDLFSLGIMKDTVEIYNEIGITSDSTWIKPSSYWKNKNKNE
jgi:hypothetical protein